MEVRLKADLQEKLTRLANEQGRDSESLVVEAVERLVNYDEWFLQEVKKGLAAAERGDFVGHEDVKKLIDDRYRD
jgi:predicted transcriptional regulator